MVKASICWGVSAWAQARIKFPRLGDADGARPPAKEEQIRQHAVARFSADRYRDAWNLRAWGAKRRRQRSCRPRAPRALGAAKEGRTQCEAADPARPQHWGKKAARNFRTSARPTSFCVRHLRDLRNAGDTQGSDGTTGLVGVVAASPGIHLQVPTPRGSGATKGSAGATGLVDLW